MSGSSPFPIGFFTLNPGGYTGPGDILTTGWQAWYGLRAFKRSLAGTQPALIVRRASDSTTKTIYIAGNGYLDAASLATFIAGTTGYVTQLYDQSGNGNNATQATTAKQPQITVTGGPGSFPCVNFVGSSDQYLQSGSALSIGAGATVMQWYANRSAAFTTIGALMGPTSIGNPASGWFTSANELYVNAGTTATISSVPDSAFHSIACNCDGSSNSNINIDGTNTAISPGSDTFTTALVIGGNTGAGQYFTGKWMESGINNLGASISTSQLNSLSANATNAWAA